MFLVCDTILFFFTVQKLEVNIHTYVLIYSSISSVTWMKYNKYDMKSCYNRYSVFQKHCVFVSFPTFIAQREKHNSYQIFDRLKYGLFQPVLWPYPQWICPSLRWKVCLKMREHPYNRPLPSFSCSLTNSLTSFLINCTIPVTVSFKVHRFYFICLIS